MDATDQSIPEPGLAWKIFAVFSAMISLAGAAYLLVGDVPFRASAYGDPEVIGLAEVISGAAALWASLGLVSYAFRFRIANPTAWMSCLIINVLACVSDALAMALAFPKDVEELGLLPAVVLYSIVLLILIPLIWLTLLAVRRYAVASRQWSR